MTKKKQLENIISLIYENTPTDIPNIDLGSEENHLLWILDRSLDFKIESIVLELISLDLGGIEALRIDILYSDDEISKVITAHILKR